MPELPEVETIKRGLDNKLIGKKIADITIKNPKSFQGNKNSVLHFKIVAVSRRAKVIRIQLVNNENLLIHLKMTGQLIYIDKNNRLAGGHPSNDWHSALPNKHTRVIFTFNDNSKLFFNDLRKFGWCKVMSNQEVNKFFDSFGPEPFSKEFSLDYLLNQAERFPSRTIIQFLMDQKIIAGIGNIYANESLFLARIRPTTKVKFLKATDWQRVITSVQQVLKMGLQYGGTTDNNYVNIEGEKGKMQNHLNVYHRAGEPCPADCKGIVEKVKLGERGAFYCKSCQKELK